jgi:hypothetical protein
MRAELTYSVGSAPRYVPSELDTEFASCTKPL